MKRILSTLALVALLGITASASAKSRTLYYKGKTDHGNAIAFSLKGTRMFGLDGYVTTTCVPTKGTPRPGRAEFNPPGSFALGSARKVSSTRVIPWWGKTTFNYKVELKKRRGRVWLAKLHVNYAYVQFLLLGEGQVDETPFVCQGDDTFTFST